MWSALCVEFLRHQLVDDFWIRFAARRFHDLTDEPTGELDSATGAEVFGLLRKLCADRETTVVVVTHDPSFVEPTDRILRMKDGQLEQPD